MRNLIMRSTVLVLVCGVVLSSGLQYVEVRSQFNSQQGK